MERSSRRLLILSMILSSCAGSLETETGLDSPIKARDQRDSGTQDNGEAADPDDERAPDLINDEQHPVDAGLDATDKPDPIGPEPEAVVDPSVPPPRSCDVGPGRVGLQRLTRSEYNRTVRDLFRVTGDPASVLPSDSTTGGFDNNALSLSMSPQSLELWLDVADAVSNEAMQNDGDTIMTCAPAESDEDACIRGVLMRLGRRVYRRPLDGAELESLMRFVDFARDGGEDLRKGTEYALAAMLVSPQFLYRNVPVARDSAGVRALDDFALATRLSYFLWGSTPDEQLLASAEAGDLRSTVGLRDEFERMLRHERAAALYDGFFSQWLSLGKLASAWPDHNVLPEYSEDVHAQMVEEVRLFFEDVLSRNGSALEFVNGRRTFANELLADIYGITGITGDELVPVDTDAEERAGVLTMPAILTMTSDPATTNVVRRGAWLAETILCTAPPPPPEDVPPLPDQLPGETERQRLERHRADPVCAPCHEIIDPLGFAFDNYDPVGRWRDVVDGEPADATGQLPGGRSFQGITGLRDLLERDDDYKRCITQKLMTYALGRSTTREESCLLTSIGQQVVTPSSTFTDLLWAVVTSGAFQQTEGDTL